MPQIQLLLLASALSYVLLFFFSWRKQRDQKRQLSRVTVIAIRDVASSQRDGARSLNVFLPADRAVIRDRRHDVIYVNDSAGEGPWRPIEY